MLEYAVLTLNMTMKIMKICEYTLFDTEIEVQKLSWLMYAEIVEPKSGDIF